MWKEKYNKDTWLWKKGLRKRGNEMLCVEIDELTPCLTDNETGEIVETEVIRVKRKSFLSKYNKETGWYVTWMVAAPGNNPEKVTFKK